jgi:hypothetical protein
MKTCTSCLIEKSLDDFYRKGKSYKSHCKKCCSEYTKKYYEGNKETHNQNMKKHYFENKEKYSENHKKYRSENSEKILEIAKTYNKKRRKTDILFRLKLNLRSRINGYLKTKKITKTNRTIDFIGCNPDELKKHLENLFDGNMNWENYGKWEIDHIIPLSEAKNIEDIYKLNNFTNLQPMWKLDNIMKGSKLDF